MEVESTTRRSSCWRSALSCASRERSPCSGSTRAGQRSSACAVRRISAMPGRKTRISPGCASSASRTAFAAASGRSRGDMMSRLAWITSTGNILPSLVITGAASKAESFSASAVADIARMRSSGRRPRCRSRTKARARSASRLRSCTSSKITSPMPSSPGSESRREVSSPSVITSMRVFGPTALSSRVRKPTVSPATSPSSSAMRIAAARAARRRGSSSRILPPMPASSAASGTVVVLPAPGGATSTALPPGWPSACSRAGRASATGRSVIIAPG